MISDSPIVDEVRRRRCEISSRFGHDVHKYFDYLREVQQRYRDRLVGQVTVVPTAKPPAGRPQRDPAQ